MWIALLSDFGDADHYVGAMKGVLARLAPNARVVDITHRIPPYDRVRGGLALYQAYAQFPRKTVFVAVVDPGVGSARQALLVETQDYFFLGPDNGVLSMALAEQKIRRIVHLNNEKYFQTPVSATFHGRDVFAPAAAHLAQGLAPEFFGPELTDYRRLPDFVPTFDAKRLAGSILAFDRFGTAVTNLSRNFLQRHYHRAEWEVRAGGHELRGLRSHYAEVAPGEPLLLFGSGGLLEIAVREGSAEEQLALKRGDPVLLPL
jgi:S-adenosylmethionine hydrolase